MSVKTGKPGQEGFSYKQDETKAESVECLGLTFESDEARRKHFLELLRENLQNPEFRKTPGFPKGSDEDILKMSDPPYYTACPNPFLADFVRVYGKPYDPDEPYEREPFAVDVSVGKTDQLYKAHGYHTKVPHLAIVPSILHYTKPGDLVLDGFSGSGMTGLAAQWCGTAPIEYRRELETQWKGSGHVAPEWGARRVILNDLGPAASFISAGYNLPFDLAQFEKEAQRILNEVEAEIGWMYEVLHTDGKTKGRINYTVWSEVFSCPECAGEVNFVAQALDKETGTTRAEFPCPHCDVTLTKKRLDRFYITDFDRITGANHKVPKRVPVLINYNVGSATHERPTIADDIALLEKIEKLGIPAALPRVPLPYMHRTHERARMDLDGVTHVHHFFLARTAHALAALWRKANAIDDVDIRRSLRFWLDSHFVNLSIQNRYRPHVSFPYNPLSGVYYIGSMISDADYLKAYENKLKRILAAFAQTREFRSANMAIATGDCASLGVPSNSVDYIFTDPPFGENIYYSDLNFLVESWHGVLTRHEREAIVDQNQQRPKRLADYQQLMRACFNEYHRVLKPGRWMTVVFSNNSNAVWRAIQEALGVVGFVVADVRTLDKQQGSFNQVAGHTVKQDLVISAYKPTEALTHRFELGHASPEDAWAFVREHLGNVPIFVGRTNEGDVVAERTAQLLLDRMIAFHVQRGIAVPLSAAEFLQGLHQRFIEREGMYFLPDQLAEYDQKRTSVPTLRQLNLFVSDEHSAIQWIRQQLQDKPQRYQDLQPQFMRELQAWAKHEKTVELKVMLDQNFLQYGGNGPVPSQIQSYLSTNFKELRNLDKEDSVLIAKAHERWYVPDPDKQGDKVLLREKALLKEFEEYKTSRERKLKVFRTEAVRAGFKACWQERDYVTIIQVAEKLPDAVLQEDEKLLMYYDNSVTRTSTD